MIKQTEENLPENKRFIIVNAWNEWAEGAHLEPDLQFGYAYLNSVGRALSDHPFSENPSETSAPKKMTTLRIEIPENLLGDILKNSDFSAKFFHIIKNTSLFKNSQMKTFLDKSCYDIFSSHGISTIECSELTDCDYTLSFRRPCLFTLDGLERMLDMAWRHPNSRILANTYDSQSDFAEVRGDFSTPHWAGFQAAIVLESREPVLCSKICPGMMAFVTDLSNTNKNRPEVTTIATRDRMALSNSAIEPDL